MNIPRENARDVDVAFDERSVDHEFRVIVADLFGAPRLDLLTKRIEIALNAVHTNRQRIYDREILRVFRKDRRELALERQVVANKHAQTRREPEAHGFVIGVPDSDRETAAI